MSTVLEVLAAIDETLRSRNENMEGLSGNSIKVIA
jgi:hypothetical protein